MTIRDSINEIVKKQLPIVSKPCRVVSVDEAGGVCDVEPLDGTAKMFDVLLNANLTDETGFVVIPAVDSVVYVTLVNKNLAFVSLSAVIDKVFIKINDISLTVDENEIALNGDQFDGLVKVGDLVTKLNAVENDLNTLKTALASWVVVPSDGGAALKAITASWFGSSLVPTIQGDIENTKVKQG